MKKKIMIGLLLAMVTAGTTGCGNSKTLTCSYKDESSSIVVEEKYTFKFDKKGEKLKSYSETVIGEFIDYTEEEIAEEYEDAKEECDELNKKNGVTCRLKRKGNKLELTQTLTVSKLDEEEKDGIDKITYDALKEEYADSKITCK